MDFMNRSVRQPNEAPQMTPEPAPAPTKQAKKPRFKKSEKKWVNLLYVFMVFSATVVILAILTSLVFSTTKNESKYIDHSKLQAVFLNNGQVYFGNIDALNDDYVKLNNIYYLRVNQQVQPDQQANPNDVSLAKLGCELHGPQDQMIINRSEVTFWENLKGDGQVAKAVEEFVKANPNGQNCQQNQSSGTPQTEAESGANNANNSTSGTTQTNTNTNSSTGSTPSTNNTNENNQSSN